MLKAATMPPRSQTKRISMAKKTCQMEERRIKDTRIAVIGVSATHGDSSPASL
jgi:hypothetical protein